MKAPRNYTSPTVWLTLEALFQESKQYRGDNGIRLKDLEKMLESIIEHGMLKDPHTSIEKNGGAFSCRYTFDPKIWGKWFTSQDLALSMASMDKDVVSQYAGRSQGGTVHKTNWGGRVVNVPGKPRGDFERMPSAMDRYDVLMQADVTTKAKSSKKGETEQVPVGELFRVAYSPSIGSTEERKARLLALISGGSAPSLKRRVQPHIPEPGKDDLEKAANRPAQSVPRVGQNIRLSSDDEGGESPRSASGAAPSHFTSFLSKHSAEYEPQKRGKTQDDEADDAMQALFPRKK